MKFSEKQELALVAINSTKSPYTEILYGGAAGGGKSVLLCASDIFRRLQYPNTFGFIARNSLHDLMRTSFQTYISVYNEIAYPVIGEMKFNGQLKCIEYPNGSKTWLGYLNQAPDDREFKRLGSYNLTDVHIDEAGECPFDGVTVIKSRIRENLINGKPVLVMASNPTYGWLKDNWIKKEGKRIILPDNKIFIPAYVDDNPDDNFVKNYKKTLDDLPDYHRNRLLKGDWDYQTNESGYYPEFSERAIYDNIEIIKDVPILLTFDFNYDPTTCVLMQNDRLNRSGLLAIKEFSMTGGTRPLSMKIREYLGDNKIYNPIRVTGDSSGHSRSSKSGVVTDFNIIQEVFKVPKSWINYRNDRNMAHGLARDIINELLHYDLIKISLSGCPELIQDLRKAKPDKDGIKLLKDRDRYKMDLHDAFKYGCLAEFPDSRSIKIY